ncbi:MAG: class I SAM-dependent methyltransferase [Eubacteriales bacterium]
MEDNTPLVCLEIAPEREDSEMARRLAERFGTDGRNAELILKLDGEGLSLISDGRVLKGDFVKLLPRIAQGRIGSELLVRAARLKGIGTPHAIDATAGLGDDSVLLAAAGFRVTMFERNPVIYELLCDAAERARAVPELREIVERMEIINGDSIAAMPALEGEADVILLDPMFPERQKSALVKKKLQMIQKLEAPCADERELLLTAMRVGPKKLIVKRPPKGAYLAGIKPDHSVEGKAVRFDCFVSPKDRIHKFI